MSRRKQQRPRPVKALVQTDDYRSITEVAAECGDVSEHDIIYKNELASRHRLETLTDDIDNKSVNTVSRDHFNSSVTVASSPPCVSQTSGSTLSIPSSASSVIPVNESEQCEQLVNNVSGNLEDKSQFDSNIDVCLLCLTQLKDGANIKAPVEGNDYFIDCDGTLAIRNGVCPRSLALSLFSEVLVHRSKYTKLLGKNMFKFLLNLKQIVTKQRKTCPGENPSAFISAENVLKNFSFMEKECHSLTDGSEGDEVINTFKMEEKSQSDVVERDIVSSNIPDKSLNESSHQLPLLDDESSHKEKNLVSILSQLPTSVQDHIYNSVDTGHLKSDASDNGSIESFSRVASPSSSLSSVNSGPSSSDRAKEMTNTKRGCKILPVASTDGQTHYLCPVCNLELSSDHELTIHIRSHNQTGQQSMPNTCTICGKTLSSQSSLDRHMLVHSGERPFKCKICDMSFTTNGNMHRHARIHEKNGIITPKSTGRKPIQHKPLSKEDTPFHEEKSNSGSLVQVPVSVTSESECDKMDLSNSHLSHQEQSAFLHPYYRFFFPYGAHHPAYPYPQLLPLPFLQTVMHPLTGESFAQYVNSLSRMAREPSPDLRVQQRLHCNVCDTVFNNQFTLDSHMETHVLVDKKLEAESGSTCKSCKTVAKSEASLLLHSLKYHLTKNESTEADVKSDQKQASPSPLTATSPLNCPTNSSNAVGFQNLGFANFTTKKFPLIAKFFCESFPSTKAVRLPVYKCKDCDLEFPVEGAKQLHEASHVPEEYTMCPKCNCHFSEPSRLQEHMQKHISDLKFEESSEQINLDHEKCMLQYHFLAQFGLTPKDMIDQTFVKNDFENVDICVEERSVSSFDENNKVIHLDEDDNLEVELNQTTNEDEHCKEQKAGYFKMSTPKNMLPTTIISETKIYNNNNNNTLLMPYFKVSQKLSEDNEDFLASPLTCSSPSIRADSDPSSNIHGSALRVSNVPATQTLRCKHCNVTVTSPRALKYHLYTHKNTSQFQCKVCDYSSADKNTLLRHMRVHSGERPYKCLICEYSFTTKANCERHLRQKHGLEKNQVSDKLVCNKHILSGKSKQPSSATDSRHGPLSKAAGGDLSSWRYLQPRNSTNSVDQMNYTCKKCMKTFTSHTDILHHISTHHPHMGQDKMGKLIAAKNDVTLTDMKLTLPSPPLAHLKSPLPSTIAMKCSAMDTVIVKQEHHFQGPLENSISDHFPTHLNMMMTKGDIVGEANSIKPLDFSTQQKYRVALSQREDDQLMIKSAASLTEENCESVPIDLSIQKPLNITALVKSQDQSPNTQRCPGLLPAAAQRPDKTSVFQSSHDGDNSHVANVHAEDCSHKSTVVSAKSPTESDSSCDFASVNKILDVTDTQNFHSYLHAPETEDEQEIYISESASSDEESSISSGRVLSSLQTSPSNYHSNASPATNSVWKKNHSNIKFTDSSNMNEQAIAELIEKVSQENGISPAKKKKNSYADSPHKFACPFCPRCFPWLSSLNRHLLTHTGQKPFKCPRCPVIFSTKSNRERHLIRKHNVNMLDPASRSTMDRPYKCHICMFSSFSTHNNLMKHYKDKHIGVAVPSRGIGVEKHLFDGGWDDSQLNGGGNSYEDEEEYNSMVEMQGGISDKVVMYENYAQDSDSNHSSSNNSAFLGDVQVKNTIFNLNSNEFHKSTNKHTDNSPDINMTLVKRETSFPVTNDSHLTDTRENYLSKSVSSAAQVLSKHTVKDNSKMIITQECHKQPFPNSEDVDGLSIQNLSCDRALSSHKFIARHQKSRYNDFPFQCSFCDDSFVTRLECLQHFEQVHQEAWVLIKEKNDIRNVQVFSTRLDKMIDKFYKKEREIYEKGSDRNDNEELDTNLQQKSANTYKSSMNKNKENKSETDTEFLAEEHKVVNLGFKLDKQELQKNGCTNSGFDVSATICPCDETCCSLCPERFKSLQDLKTHMNSHIDAAKMYPGQLKVSVKSKVMSLPTPTSNHKVFRRGASTDKSCGETNGNHTDMLHDLLGVESSTIDQIFESSDSAASLLGVYM